jgi:uncharacterized protein (TIRG00374 family)
LLRIGLIVLLFAVVVFAVDRFVPGAQHHLGQADGWWLAIAAGLEATACASYVLLFHRVFSRVPYLISVRRSAQIALGELGAFAIVPTGIGGPVLRVWALRAGGMPLRTIIVRSLAHAGIFNAPYVLAAVVLGVGVSLALLPGHAPVLTALAPLGLVLLSCALVGLAVALSRAPSVRGGSVWRARVRSALTTVPDGLRDLLACARRPGAWLGAVGWWACDCAALWASFRACGGTPAISVVAIAYMLGQLGNLAPLPGGVGGVEPVMLGIFVASGVDAGIAGAAIVCYRAIALGFQGLAGAVAFITLASDLRGDQAFSRSQTSTAGRPA